MAPPCKNWHPPDRPWYSVLYSTPLWLKVEQQLLCWLITQHIYSLILLIYTIWFIQALIKEITTEIEDLYNWSKGSYLEYKVVARGRYFLQRINMIIACHWLSSFDAFIIGYLLITRAIPVHKKTNNFKKMGNCYKVWRNYISIAQRSSFFAQGVKIWFLYNAIIFKNYVVHLL